MNKGFYDVLGTVLSVKKEEVIANAHDFMELSLESIDIVSLIAAMDVYLNIKATVSELKSCKYLKDILDLVETKQNESVV